MNHFKDNSKGITQSVGSKVITTSKNESDSFLLNEETLDMIRYIASVDSITFNEALISSIEHEFMRKITKYNLDGSKKILHEKE